MLCNRIWCLQYFKSVQMSPVVAEDDYSLHELAMVAAALAVRTGQQPQLRRQTRDRTDL